MDPSGPAALSDSVSSTDATDSADLWHTAQSAHSINTSAIDTEFDFCLDVGNPADSINTTSSETKRCPICGKTRRVFYCADCVQGCQITHSRVEKSELWSRKKRQLEEHTRELDRLNNHMKQTYQQRTLEDLLRQDSLLFQRKIDARRRIMTELKKAVDAAVARQLDVERELQLEESMIGNLQDDFIDIEVRTDAASNHIADLSEQVALQRERGSKMTLASIRDLRRIWLPEDLFVLASDDETTALGAHPLQQQAASSDETVVTVPPDQQTTTAGSAVTGDHVEDIITPPQLLVDGQPSHAYQWLRLKQLPEVIDDDNAKLLHRARQEAGALVHFATATRSLANYLKIILPHALCPTEFTLERLDEQRLRSAVARLNFNIVTLCLTQQVDQANMRPQEIRQNLTRLFDTLERNGPRRPGFSEMTPELASLIDTELAPDLQQFDVNVETEILACEGAGDHMKTAGPIEWEPLPMVASTPEEKTTKTSHYGTFTLYTRVVALAGSMSWSPAAIMRNFKRAKD